MKKLKVLMVAVLCIITALGGLAGCNKTRKKDGELDDDGNFTGTEVANVDFWGWGDPEEIAIFRKLVDKFNEENEMINVKYIQKPADGYASSTAQAMSGKNGPDVVYVSDRDIKQWVSLDLLAPMDNYLKTSKVIESDDIWPTALQRYRVDKATGRSRPEDPLYSVPKDVGPTVIYYNADAFRSVGVTEIVSIYEEDIDAYNAAHSTNYQKRGYDPVTKIFNNKIAMTWEESEILAKMLTQSYNSSSPTRYGYFTEWWFSYGWSVGGHCLKYDEASGNWKFTLGDTTVLQNEKGEDMPTMREAFTHFVQLSQPTSMTVDGDKKGLAVAPSPSTLTTVGKVGYFTSGQVAMLVDARFSNVTIRKTAKFDWDVCPLPRAEKGVEAGHSNSVGMAISAKSRVKNAAWKFCEYIAGKEGQADLAEAGFNVPIQKSVANTEVFLQSDKKPKNAEIYLRAAEIQKPGDWWDLSDSLWIKDWSALLNGDVRNGKMTLTQFFAAITDSTNKLLEKYTT